MLADACNMPLPNCCQDFIICIEAQFHFASRMTFLREAARILRPKGKMILTDILIDPLYCNNNGQTARPSNQQIRNVLNDGYGPWPEPFLQYAALIEAAKQVGLELIDDEDISDNILPSYTYICPEYQWVGVEQLRSSGLLLAWLQANGYATYHYACFEKTLSLSTM
jgi:ubiquinone/menaquinone biosynthesis C-methylase UbiE